MYKRLYIWVEGGDDIRFFDRVVKPIFEEEYNLVQVSPYAKLKKEKVNNFLRSIKAMHHADYIFVADINTEPCVTAKKQKLKNVLSNVDEHRIAVIIMEIESWYLAGLDATISKELGVRPLSTTDSITKEQFNNLIPKKFDSRTDFMMEILKYFSMEIANQKNRSFRYFAKKYKLR